MIEWPPGSGRRGLDDQADTELVNGLLDQLDAGTITGTSWMQQVATLHDLKVELAAEQV